MRTKAMCIYLDCFRVANFNYVEGRNGIYCRKHAKEGMIDKRHISRDQTSNYRPETSIRKGTPELCSKKAPYSFPSKSTHGEVHAERGKIDKCDRCILCDKRVSYDTPGIPKGLFCILHYKVMLELLDYSEAT
jgi:hypothetical protein